MWPDREKRRVRYRELSNGLMDAPVGILLSYLAWQISIDGPDSKICTERYAYKSYIEKYHGHRADLDKVRGLYKARPRTVSRRVSLESMNGRSTYDSCHPNIASWDRPVASVDPTSESEPSDDDNISDFLKLLESKKDLKSFTRSDQSAKAAAMHKTTAQFSKYQRMRESHTGLAESVSSSTMLHRSSAG
ncbi:unnamed protein product [Alternaria alternata]